MPDDLLTVPEVAKAARVSIPTVRAWIWEGLLPAKRLTRGAWFVSKAALALWLSTPDNLRQKKTG